MKIIIWVFGESATGKRTFINNLYGNDINTMSTLDLTGKKITISEITLGDREHKKEVIYSFSEYNIPITIVESSNNGYIVEDIINAKSSNIKKQICYNYRR